MLKRTYHVTAKDLPIAKRLRRVEAQAYRNRAEMKSATVQVSGALGVDSISLQRPCMLPSGTDMAERIGDKIRIWRIEVRGASKGGNDLYIVQCKTTTQLTAAYFGTAQGAFLLDSENTNRFTEWRHLKIANTGTGTSTGFKLSHKFKGGILVKYNGPLNTNVIDNEIVVASLNRSDATTDIDYSVRIWYTDA